jgi:exodeoxyribonuclease VII small subunit
MEPKQDYSSAYAQLEELVARLEHGDIPLEQLPAIVKEADRLIARCENHLRKIEEELDETMPNREK